MLRILFATLPFFIAISWLTAYIIDFKEHTREKKIFSYLLGLLAATYLAHAAFFLDERKLFGLFDSLYAFCTLAIYPLVFLFIRALTDPKPLCRKDFWMLGISSVAFIWSMACYAAMGSDRTIFINYYFFHEGPAPERTPAILLQMVRLSLTRLIFGMQLFLVLVYGNRHLNSFKKQVSDFYSNVDGRDMRSIRMYIHILWVYSLCALILSIAGRTFFARSTWLLGLSSIVFSTLLYGACYAVRHEKFSISSFKKDVSAAADASSPDIDAPAAEPEEANPSQTETLAATAAGIDAAGTPDEGAIISETPVGEHTEAESEQKAPMSDRSLWIGPALDALMEEKELFKKKDLLITDIARMIGTNRTYVSQYLNNERNLNFSDYVNGYRVEYAKRLMDENREMTLVELSELAGFASEASFYRVFKRIAGQTPNAYRNLAKA